MSRRKSETVAEELLLYNLFHLSVYFLSVEDAHEAKESKILEHAAGFF